MTFGKAGLITAGLVAVFALGVMTGPTIRDNWNQMNAPEETAAAQPAEKARPHQSRPTGQRLAPGPSSSRSRAERADRADDVVAAKKPSKKNPDDCRQSVGAGTSGSREGCAQSGLASRGRGC